ncbi:DedA family protein [Stygiobacter electus]|uniref:DedA family protein n=1 Tax=Stygiobacter electus TaxID=3032292 RepID=A0AAE3P2U7_9BACT|nr:DedA family protein [Stygiobacter electus]MDF1612757.1 DedA family protein [Stygiobacter electus]
MLEQVIAYINSLDPVIIYLLLFFFSFIENIFPPSPSDIVVVIAATLISKNELDFLVILLITTIASTIGFIAMYLIGEFSGENIIRKGKLKFIKQEYLEKADKWFHKFGYNLILINRFMPGTRAVISFFCGVHRLNPLRSFIAAATSSLIWNLILIFLGITLGNNIQLVDKYLNTYSNIGLIVTIILVSFFLIKFLRRRKK